MTDLKFSPQEAVWMPERSAIAISAERAGDELQIWYTDEALAMMIGPEVEPIEGDEAMDTFLEFEVDLQRIVLREVRSRPDENPLIIRADDVALP